MVGPSITDPTKTVGREVPKPDVNVYANLGYRVAERPVEVKPAENEPKRKGRT